MFRLIRGVHKIGAGSALSTSEGQPLQEYLQRLSSDYLGRLLRELLLKDMATWGERHIFGNVERRNWRADSGIPFLSLTQLYVEPNAWTTSASSEDGEPVIKLIESLLKEPKKHVVVVKADFGMGKSLTARSLAQRWAQQFLTGRETSSEHILPVFIRCAEDLPSDDFDLEKAVRRAWKRQAGDLDVGLKTSDTSLALPEKDQRTVFLIDGLDEVILDERRLKVFFEHIRDQATPNHRFILLSRPGALPSEQDLKNIPVVEILPWREEQIDKWLRNWRQAHEGQGLSFQEVKARGLDSLAGTPILLFMIAQTWSRHTQGEGTSQAALYEEFFWQIAKGKHDDAREHHQNIAESSEKLLKQLTKQKLLDESASEPDAMLWLMGRVAWEATKRQQRSKYFDQEALEELTEREIENLIEDELGLRSAPDTLKAIQGGLLLSMQAHLRAGRASRLLFGHKTFREYLAARYWADRLKALAQAREKEWKKIEEPLLDGRLLSREDRTFEFLMEMLNGEPLTQHPNAPFGLAKEYQRELLAWAQDRFESEEHRYPARRPEALREDRMPWLREGALAIGSCLHGSPGMQVKDSLTVRAMLAWFWLMRVGPILIAPKARWEGSVLSELSLRGANFREADLRGVLFTGANLMRRRVGSAEPCDFTKAQLDRARLFGAMCTGSLFVGASLKNALLDRGDFEFAQFSSACLRNASLERANLRRAVLHEADLTDAVLTFAKLDGADLRDAKLRSANLLNASLKGAVLDGASLEGALLHGANLSEALLHGANLKGAIYDKSTQWPYGFNLTDTGAILADEPDTDVLAVLS
ncbi:pentapeptide repeat-containing protein [Hyalangium rubrum]|uniref:Pentapeptide repeat-containing protein n=1 Tax=Hyalangium rubrum TaxID=3103134 RepID=A0ABU5GYU7_9BACT|nr:pentapeptide repeat-containing protein [Hyalangium sp. s54d21]MDY7225717.1 pentapeptide repeat-containing protein [Hyalangium sp. s54d21]